MAANDRFRVGVVGCGFVARRHLQQVHADPRAEWAVFCDPNLDTARALRDQYAPLAAATTSETDAIANSGLDAVVLCSPTQVHYRQCCLALDRDVHVLCEKPLALKRTEIVDLIARQQASGKLLSVGYQRRYQAPYVTARRELTENAAFYGPVKEVHVMVCERWQQSIPGTWRDDPAVGAGYFGDAGSHQIDVLAFIAGLRPVAVYARSEQRGSRVEIVTRALARLSNGAGLVAHFVGDGNHWREDIAFYCDQGDLLLRSEQLFRCRANQIEPITDLVPPNAPVRAFFDAISAGTTTVSPPECALPMFDWTAAVLESKARNAWIEVGPSLEEGDSL